MTEETSQDDLNEKKSRHESHDLTQLYTLPCVVAPLETILLRSAVQISSRSEVISSSTGFFTLSSVMIFY